ncbi:MAG: hypothetical protein FJY07_04525 [Bacteroidetes bacterium]|nr:hypothetical protein [Bacteroidota bacterium]
MFKKIFTLLCVILAVPFIAKSEWVSINKNKAANTPPLVTLISDDNSSTVLKIEIAGFRLNNLATKDHQYQTVDLLSESFTGEAGFPAVPYIAKVLAVPDMAGVSVEILDMGEVQTFSNINLPPARENWQEGAEESPYTENAAAYSSLAAYPNDYSRLDPPMIFRDFRIARVSVFPVRYVAAKKELKVASSITVRIDYSKGTPTNPKLTPKKPIAPSFGQLYSSIIFNYQSVLGKNYGGKETGHELMLCIMPDEFYTSFQTFATWKRQSGIDIHITKFSDIGANATNPDIIKNHITDAYHNWDVPPTYVLIVGDNGVFPHKIVSYDYSFPNDDFFVEIDGNDYFPEMMIGRFTNESDYQMQVMINKFVKYEKTPYTTSTTWFKKGICC